MKCDVLLNNESFPTLKSFLKKAYIKVDISDREDNLLKYSLGKKVKICPTKYIEGYQYNAKRNVADDLSFSNYINLCNSLYKKLSGSDNQDEISSFTIRYYWGLRLEIFFYKQNVEEFIKGERSFMNTGLSLDSIVFLIAHLFILGWTEESYQLTRDLHDIISIKFDVVSGVKEQEKPSDAQYFILNYLNKQQDWNIPSTINFEPTSTVYKRILQHWNSLDITILEEVWLEACNKHINESKFFEDDDNFQKYYDFGKYEFFYYPFEILVVKRMRERENLPFIEIDHPLFKTCLGVLPTYKESSHYYDAFLIGLLTRIKSEYPNFAKDYILPKSPEFKKNSWKFW